MTPRTDGYNPVKWQAAEMRKRPRRAGTRWLLLFGVLLILAQPVIVMEHPGDSGNFMPIIMPMLLPLIFGASMSPFARSAKRLDEFERAALFGAMRRSWLVTALFPLAVFGWLALAQQLGWPLPHLAKQWIAIGLTLMLATMALPLLLAEWTVPLPPVTDVLEDEL